MAQAHTSSAATKSFCLLVKAQEQDESPLQMGREACETGSNKIMIMILEFVPRDGSVGLGAEREKRRGRESRMEGGTGRGRELWLKADETDTDTPDLVTEVPSAHQNPLKHLSR